MKEVLNTIRWYGHILAMILSWNFNHSIGWAVFQGMLGWFYVIYYYVQYM